MAGNLGVTIEKLQETVQTLNDENGNMQAKLQNIADSVSNLRSSWESPAAENLQSIASNMSARFEELRALVNDFALFLQNSIDNYETTEGKAEEMMSSVMQAFN